MGIKKFRTCYFVLYDMEDNPICYFDNIMELLKHINYRDTDLLSKFSKNYNNINIVIGKRKYKLYRFCD